MGLLREISGDEKKPSKPVIEPPGKPREVVVGAREVGGAGQPAAPLGPCLEPEPEKISCRHLQTKKILLIGNDSMGNLDWSDVESVKQCLECTCILRGNSPQ